MRDQVSKEAVASTVMHLDVKNRAPPRVPQLLCEIPGHHLGTNFSHPQFFSQYQTNGKYSYIWLRNVGNKQEE